MDEFTEYFSLAQTEALTKRDCRIVELRYGFAGSDCHTLQEIGQVIGVSRERIRQILAKAQRRVCTYGKWQIRRGSRDKACAQLLLWLTGKLKPNEPGSTERVVDFIESDLAYLPSETHALPLIQCLMQGVSNTVDWDQASARIKAHRRAITTHTTQVTRFQTLLSYVIWPRWVRAITQDELAQIHRTRDVFSDGNGSSGTFSSVKVGRVVQFESLLELDFFLMLEECPQVTYYQEQPLRISYQVEEKELLYYPDVLLVLADGKAIVAEIKPIFQMALHRNLEKWSALRKFCALKGWGMLVTDGRHAIQEVQRQPIHSEFAQAILNRLNTGPLSWPDYKAIRDEYGVGRNDFLALVLQNKLVWMLQPFQLTRNDQKQEPP